MTYADYLINGALGALIVFGLAATIGGFATAVTNADFGGRVVRWWIICCAGVIISVFGIVTAMYRGHQ